MITILSDSGQFKADLDDVEDGVTIAFWQQMQGDEPTWKLICRQTVDIAFHVACDFAHDTVNELVVPSTSWPTPAQKRGRVRFIGHALKSIH
jgi:hypothetical protein